MPNRIRYVNVKFVPTYSITQANINCKSENRFFKMFSSAFDNTSKVSCRF